MPRFILTLLLSALLFPENILAEPAQRQVRFSFSDIAALKRLPNNEVLNMIQDSDGFIWIGTRMGLYRFDGYDLLEFRRNLATPDIITDNWISALVEDGHKRILIGTKTGLNIYDMNTGMITRCEDPLLNHNIISGIAVTADDQVFLGTDRGVVVYHPDSNSCEPISYGKLRGGSIKGMLTDSNGYTWVGTWDAGLYRYSPDSGEWYIYPALTPLNSAHVIYEDSMGRLWVGTFGEGVVMMEKQYDIDGFTKTVFTSSSSNGISDNFVYDIKENPATGTIWLGTRRGISVSSLHANQAASAWDNYFPDYNSGALNESDIDALVSDRQGNVWVGGFGGVQYVKTSNNCFHYFPLASTFKQFHSAITTCIFAESKSRVWTGISNTGLSVSDPESGHEIQITGLNKRVNRADFDRVGCLIQSRKTGELLLATLTGIVVRDKNGGYRHVTAKGVDRFRIEHIEEIVGRGYLVSGRRLLGILDYGLESFESLSGGPVDYPCATATSGNIIFAAQAGNGIIRIKRSPGREAEIVRYCTGNGNLPSDDINTLFVDSEKRLWAGTNGAGLCYYDGVSDSFISLNSIMSFPTDVITSIAEDDYHTLWLGSYDCLIRVFPASNILKSSFRIYGEWDITGDRSFCARAAYKDGEGNMFFGTRHGYVYFNPSEIAEYPGFTNVQITDILLDNKSLRSLPARERSSASPLPPEKTEKLSVDSRYNGLTFVFSSMTFSLSEKIRYAYKLEGFDKEWRMTDYMQRFAHYANLSPGTYVFKLKSTNESGEWSEYTKEVVVRVKPPVWATWWAIVVYIIIVLAVIVAITASAREKLNYKAKIKEQQMESERNIALNQEKLRFFTNITHELFTPITIISAATEESKKKIPEKQYEVISSNISRLSRLIQQILEFRKAETGNLRLLVSNRDICRFISRNIESFEPLMRQKKIAISFECEEKSHEAFFDADKVDKILYNLLSNALKYNNEGATVRVRLSFSEDGEFATFSVSDNGQGLSERAVKNLFKRFYDGDYRKFNTSGTGIGLSLVNDLVKLHKGSIDVDNRPGEGVTFIVTIPVTSSHYTKEECDIIPTASTSSRQGSAAESETSLPKDKLHKVLVVEDNPDLNYVLSHNLSTEYEVFSAEDGEAAMEIVCREPIDLIVSDVMMPKMDGYELCSAVKNNAEYSHILVVLLTAKTEDEDVVTAYRVGADAYIPKPFSIKRLNARISNLLLSRQKQIDVFKKQGIIGPKAVNLKSLNYTSYDEKFLNRVISIVNENYSDPNFDNEALICAVGASKSTFYRKMTALTGMTGANLIKTARLKAAYEILKTKEGVRISEIAYAVGFNDPKYFKVCFTKTFGISPSEVGRSQDDQPAPEGGESAR